MEKITKGHHASQSPDMVQENMEILRQIFPTIWKEGKIDMEELKALLGEEVETEEEYYRFTWAGKSMARKEANKPSTATLRPAKEESKDWDHTQNVFIEGDNLEVLKLMQKSYAGKIKMIYIDPPYNTGKDFVYKDNYADNLGNYLNLTGQTDEEGNKLSTNTETDGRYHSNWLNMMYPRLKLARNLLKDDGVIFISIDDNEIHNLKNICNEIFGEENIEQYLWDVREDGTMPKTAKKTVRKEHEYILAVFKNERILTKYSSYKYADNEEWGNPDNDPRGPWMSANISRGTGKGTGGINSFVVTNPEGIKYDRNWAITETEYDELLEDNRIYFAKEGKGVPRKKIFKNEQVLSIQSSIFENLKSSQFGSAEIGYLLNDVSFDYPKPTPLVKRMIQIGTSENDLILDFFAGSGTTADATMQINNEEGTNRKFICVQLPEDLKENLKRADASAKKRIELSISFLDSINKPHNLAEISKERIRRAGAKIEGELNKELFTGDKKLDTGFRVFKLDSSNIRAWDGSPEALEENLFNAAQNIKEDRTDEDVLYEILLKYGLDLALPIEEKKIANKTVYNIGAGAMFICLANGVAKAVAEGIGQWKEELQPATCRVIFKDTGLTDVEKTNATQILKHYGITEVNSI